MAKTEKTRNAANASVGAEDPLDTLGLKCPLPVLKTRKRLSGMSDGAVLEIWADDPAAIVDMPHFCAEAGHALIEQRDESADGAVRLVFRIKKGG